MVKATSKQIAKMCCNPCGGLTQRAVDVWRAGVLEGEGNAATRN